MEIHRLRVSRGVAGSKFPFDLVYLAKYEDREHLADLFDWSIIMPLTGESLEMFASLQIAEQHREEEARVDTDVTKFPQGSRPVLSSLIDLENQRWLSVIPILPKFVKSTGENLGLPGYLTATNWRLADNTMKLSGGPRARGRKKRLASAVANGMPTVVERTFVREEAFNSQAYLQTPGRALRPPCLMCPRYILHTQGECNLGDLVCYGHLPMGVQKVMQESVDADDQIVEVP